MSGHESLIASLWRRVRPRKWCDCRSPEGYRCILLRGHGGLHRPHMGDGYAWPTSTLPVPRSLAAVSETSET